jgi:hypothetical protein
METKIENREFVFRGLSTPLETLVLPNETYTLDKVYEMVLSIQKNGLQNPIEINENNEIVDGVLRFLAYTFLDKTSIPTIKDINTNPIIVGHIIIKSFNIINYSLRSVA